MCDIFNQFLMTISIISYNFFKLKLGYDLPRY